jgi:hypothetical protein
MTVTPQPAHRTPTFGVLSTLRRCFAKPGERLRDDLADQFLRHPATAEPVGQAYSPICNKAPRWRAPRKAVKNMPTPTAT